MELELCGGMVRYRVGGSLLWELSVPAIRVIGEATTDNGPYLDDYFVCFAADAGSWHEASFYAEGRRELLQSLGSILGCELTLCLCASTDFDSNVLWPPHLAGKPMFTYTPVQPTWIGRLIGKLIGPLQKTQTFADDVLAELRGNDQLTRAQETDHAID